MMYPRLKLARNLLREDGALFVSCDDGEVENLRCLLNDIFGEENFVAQFVWRARQFTDARANTNVSTDHEYILGRSEDADNREPQILFLPGGEITPFQLTLTAEAEDESSQQPPFLAQIRGDETGKVQWLDRAALEAEKK